MKADGEGDDSVNDRGEEADVLEERDVVTWVSLSGGFGGLLGM